MLISMNLPETLLSCLGEKGVIVFSDVEHVIMKSDHSLKEVFKLFDLIRVLTTDHKIITRITKEVVEDFASENVVYLELRTTPKKNDSIGMTKRAYMDAVIEGLKAVSEVKLVLEMRHFGVVGIGLSGNPIAGEWTTFLPALRFARVQGLCITLHCGEVHNPTEIRSMLDFLPERVGHACCFEEEEWNKLKSSNIPVEICLTSNIRTNTISSLDVHHFADLYKERHPLILCTDDVGVFSTSLSREYKIAASAFGLGKKEIFQVARNGVEFVFADDEVKRVLSEVKRVLRDI